MTAARKLLYYKVFLQKIRTSAVCRWLLFFSLSFLFIAAAEAKTKKEAKTKIHVSGLEKDAADNVEKRLLEFSEQDKLNLLRVDNSELRQQIIQAIEPYGYFKSTVNISKHRGGLQVVVQPGPQLHITRMQVKVIGAGAHEPAFIETLASLPLKQGDVFNSPKYDDCKEALLNTAEHKGYLKARFSTARILIDRKQYTADITLILDTGQRFYFGPLNIKAKYLSENFLRRYAPFHYGEPYSTDDIIKLNNNLSSGGYFKSVVVKPDMTGKAFVPINVNTLAVPRTSYSIGAGYGTDTGPRGRLGLHIVPVNRKGDKFNAIAQGSMTQNALQAQYSIPGRDPLVQQYNITASYNYLDYNSGVSGALLGSLSSNYSKDNFQRILSLNFLYNQYTYTYQPRQYQFMAYPKASFTFSKTTSPLFSPSGYNLSFNALAAGKALGSSDNLGQASIDLKAAYTVDPIRTRFFFHGMLGATAINNIEDLPMALALFLGGSDNLKATSINSIGPGKLLNFAGIEIQKETYDKWYLIGFFDAGTVYKPQAMHWLYDAGAGLMWVSPVGPIKIGVAQPINQKFERIDNHSPKLVINMGPDL